MHEKKVLSGVEKCVFCGSDAILDHYGENLYYIYCSNERCCKVDKYACLGSTEKNAVEQWNFINRPLNRTPPPKKKK